MNRLWAMGKALWVKTLVADPGSQLFIAHHLSPLA